MALRSCSEGIDLGGGVWVRAQTKGLRRGTAVTSLFSDCKFLDNAIDLSSNKL